jgi:hypothetical protein
MIKDYADKEYLKSMQRENRPFLQNTGRALKRVAPYIAGGIIITALLGWEINYFSKFENKNIKDGFSKLYQQIEHEERFNESLFKAGGQLPSK